MILYIFTQHWVNTLVKFKHLKHVFFCFKQSFLFDCLWFFIYFYFFTNLTDPSHDTFHHDRVVLKQLQSHQNSKYNHAVPWEVTLAASPLVKGKGAESLWQHFTLLFKESLMGQPGSCLRKESRSTGPPLVIGSPCTVPPVRCDSPCRDKGVDI